MWNTAKANADGRPEFDYRAQVADLEAGAAQFVNFALIAIAKHLGQPPPTAPSPV